MEVKIYSFKVALTCFNKYTTHTYFNTYVSEKKIRYRLKPFFHILDVHHQTLNNFIYCFSKSAFQLPYVLNEHLHKYIISFFVGGTGYCGVENFRWYRNHTVIWKVETIEVQKLSYELHPVKFKFSLFLISSHCYTLFFGHMIHRFFLEKQHTK